MKDLPETIPVLKALGLPVVIDHMGRTDARAGTATAGFQSLLRVLSEGWCWVKLSGAHRLSRDAPDYPDARPFHEALVRANPARVGSNALAGDLDAARQQLTLINGTPRNRTRKEQS